MHRLVSGWVADRCSGLPGVEGYDPGTNRADDSTTEVRSRSNSYCVGGCGADFDSLAHSVPEELRLVKVAHPQLLSPSLV